MGKVSGTGGTIVCRIPRSMWERLGRLQERVSADISRQGLDPPSRSSVLRAALDLGIHAYGRRIAAEEEKRKRKNG